MKKSTFGALLFGVSLGVVGTKYGKQIITYAQNSLTKKPIDQIAKDISATFNKNIENIKSNLDTFCFSGGNENPFNSDNAEPFDNELNHCSYEEIFGTNYDNYITKPVTSETAESGSPTVSAKEDAKQVVKVEVKSAVKPEVKSAVKPEVKPDVKPEVKSDVAPKVKSHVKPKITPEAKSTVKAVSNDNVKSAVKTKITPDVK